MSIHLTGYRLCVWLCYFFDTYFIFPSPAIKSVISSIFSSGNGGSATGFIAIDISFIGLSSAAMRLDESWPHIWQR